MKKIPLCEFDPTKYGTELYMDVVDTDSFRQYVYDNPVYRTNYFSIYLITDGEEKLEVNGVRQTVQAGTIICSCPGELWIWQKKSKLNGMYLYFTNEFISSFFNDSQFLDHFYYFKSDRSTSFYTPDKTLFEQYLHTLDLMRQEIRQDAQEQHLLRAQLYELLVLLEKDVRGEKPVANQKEEGPNRGESYYISSFQQLASENFMSEHQVDFYADKLFITSNYLNKIVRQSLGISTKKYLSRLLMNEALRLLHYTSLSVNEIAEELHLMPAYFIKWFRQTKGETPLQYRKSH